MHETVIARMVIGDAEKAAKGKPIKAVSLEVGELAHIPARELEGILGTLTKWEIHVTEVPAAAKCECGFTGRPNILERGHEFCVYSCPKCGKVPRLTAGQDIKLVKVDC